MLQFLAIAEKGVGEIEPQVEYCLGDGPQPAPASGVIYWYLVRYKWEDKTKLLRTKNQIRRFLEQCPIDRIQSVKRTAIMFEPVDPAVMILDARRPSTPEVTVDQCKYHRPCAVQSCAVGEGCYPESFSTTSAANDAWEGTSDAQQ
jgi:hypothetical protein